MTTNAIFFNFRIFGYFILFFSWTLGEFKELPTEGKLMENVCKQPRVKN